MIIVTTIKSRDFVTSSSLFIIIMFCISSNDTFGSTNFCPRMNTDLATCLSVLAVTSSCVFLTASLFVVLASSSSS